MSQIPQHLPEEIEAGSVYLSADGDRVLHEAPAVQSEPGIVRAMFGPFRKRDAGVEIVKVSRHHSRTFPKKVTDFKVPPVRIVEGERIEFVQHTDTEAIQLLVHHVPHKWGRSESS